MHFEGGAMARRALFAPTISIITPARSAAQSLERTFLSVARQRSADWEHIVVTHPDDGDTASLASLRAAQDDRIVHVSASRDTAGAARNSGLEYARGRFVLFLDADDTIARGHLGRLMRKAYRTSADVVMTGYRRIGADGGTVNRRSSRVGILNPSTIGAGPPTALHGLLFKRDLLLRIGGFDTDLKTNEDWDLCLRAARQGAVFYNTGGWSAEYWITPGSLSSQAASMLRDRHQVSRRALASSDPLSTADRDDHSDGLIGAIYTVLWTGAICVARDEETATLLAEFARMDRPAPLSVSIEEGVAALFDGLVIGFAQSHAQVESRMGTRWRQLESFLQAVACISEDEGIDGALLAALERELARVGAAGAARQLGGTQVEPVLSGGRRPAALAPDTRQVVFRLPMVRPRSLATFTFAPAVCNGHGKVSLIARRLGGQLAAWAEADEGQIGRVRDLSVRVGTLARRRLHRVRHAPAPEHTTPSEAEGAWEEIFATENPWHYHCDYEQAKYERTLNLLPEGPIGRGLELACAEGHFTEYLARRVAKLTASDISATALLRCEQRCKERGLDNVEYRQLDFFDRPLGTGWDLIVSSEVLYYMSSREKLTRYAERVAEALNEGGLFLHAHAYEVSDTPDRTGFDWGDDFAAGTICQTFAATPGLVLESAIESELYRCELYRKRTTAVESAASPAQVSVRRELEPSLQADVVWNGALATRTDLESRRAYRIPVLMYHAIAETGPAGLDNWRTTPEAFEHQLRFMRRRGFRSVTMAEWNTASAETAALSGRPVVISFDDGYENFAEHAWPILKRNGFGALQFISSGTVGGRSEWDKWYGQPQDLMDWNCLADLVKQGLEVGSHCHQHRALDRMSFAQISADAAHSRETIAQKLGFVPETIAPPYGICSLAQAEALRVAGFDRVFMAHGGRAPVRGCKLRTPRMEVTGGITIESFAEMIGAQDRPQPEDVP
jgi:peptidoglycan/xylan/chitin deacetylase (PgdA/CDA1 family)